MSQVLVADELIISQEVGLAFHDLKNDATKNERLVEITRTHFGKKLVCPNAGQIINTFFPLELSQIESSHAIMDRALKPLVETFSEQLRRLTILKNASNVFFVMAAVICAVTAAASAVPVLVAALGGWCSSVLIKRESALEKLNKTAGVMIRGSKFAMERVATIRAHAELLKVEIETATAEAETVEMSIDMLHGKIEAYNSEMELIKELVLENIFLHM